MSIEGPVESLDLWLESRLRNVHTCLPGTIDKYYGHSTRKAKVKPMVKLRTVTGEILTIPAIDDVPVQFPGSATFQFLFPLKKNDGCLILFSEEGIGAFLKGRAEVNSDDFARFQFTDAICIPGLWSFKSVPGSPKSTIEIDDSGNINLNGSTKGVARLDDTTINNAITDPVFEIWRLAFNVWAGTTGGPPMPSTRAGKIDSSSNTVKAGN